MTDPLDLDDLASAHLDGATTPNEAARVAADPALQARVEELRAVRDAVRDVPPVDPAMRDDAIARALSTLDDDDAPVAGMTPVTELTPRRGLSPRAVRAVSAAAVILLLALLVPLLASVQDQDDDEAASSDSASEAVEEGGETAADGGTALEPEAAAGDDATGGTSAPGAVPAMLGTYDDLDDLVKALATGDLDERAAQETTSFSDDGAPRCSPPRAGGTMVAIAIVGGDAVEVYVRTAPEGTRTITVLSRGSCEQLDQREL
jgi:hypothetical protein